MVDIAANDYVQTTHNEYYLIINTNQTLTDFRTEDEGNTLYLNFLRNFTVTDFEFAEAADRCP